MSVNKRLSSLFKSFDAVSVSGVLSRVNYKCVNQRIT